MRRFVLQVGQAASFLEPLDSTSIALISMQLRLASHWLADGLPLLKGDLRWGADALRIINEALSKSIQAIAIFLAWHYACGSAYDTPFWQQARNGFTSFLASVRDTGLGRDFGQALEAAAQWPADWIDLIADPDAYRKIAQPNLKLPVAFGGFGETSFAQIGRGIGWYQNQEDTPADDSFT